MKCLAVLCGMGMSLWLSVAPILAAPGATTPPPAAPSATTTIRVGGILDIRVAGEPGLTKGYMVDSAGHITLDMVGQITAAGRTPDQLAAELQTRLKQYVNEPVVTVAMVAPLQQEVMVGGEVVRPGTLKLRPGDGLVEMLAAVGGLGPLADAGHATLIRRGFAQPQTINLELLLKGDLTQNMALIDGDIVQIPKRQIPSFIVEGEVRQPGRKALLDGTHVLDAIFSTGGFTDGADRTRVTLSRKTQAAPLVIDVDKVLAGETSVNVPILPDDVLLVAPKMVLQVEGEVHKGGNVLLRNGGTAMEAILFAGGFGPDADRTAIQITHKDGMMEKASLADVTGVVGGPVLRPGDLVIVGRDKPESVTLFGAVRNPGQVKYQKEMKITDVLMAAGLTESSKWKEIRVLRGEDGPGRQVLLFNLEAYLKAPKTVNLALQPGDKIFVEAQRRKSGVLRKMLDLLPLATLFFRFPLL